MPRAVSVKFWRVQVAEGASDDAEGNAAASADDDVADDDNASAAAPPSFEIVQTLTMTMTDQVLSVASTATHTAVALLGTYTGAALLRRLLVKRRRRSRDGLLTAGSRTHCIVSRRQHCACRAHAIAEILRVAVRPRAARHVGRHQRWEPRARTRPCKACSRSYGRLPSLYDCAPDDNLLCVTGSSDKTIKVWGLDFGDCHKSMIGGNDSILAVAFKPRSVVQRSRLARAWQPCDGTAARMTTNSTTNSSFPSESP